MFVLSPALSLWKQQPRITAVKDTFSTCFHVWWGWLRFHCLISIFQMMKLKFGKIKFIAQDHMSKLLRQCLNLESFNGCALGSFHVGRLPLKRQLLSTVDWNRKGNRSVGLGMCMSSGFYTIPWFCYFMNPLLKWPLEHRSMGLVCE